MSFIICNSTTGKYLHLENSWVSSVKDATKFASLEKAENFTKHNFENVFKDVPLADVEIIDINAVNIQLFTEESAAAELENMISFLRSSLECAKKFLDLNRYYNAVMIQTSGETQDLLHKIEFHDANVVNGFKLYKTLQDIRRRRRVAKDSLNFSQLLVTSGLLDSLERSVASIEKSKKKIETRSYHPRIYSELFD